jgi:hypothetical protein
MGLLTGRSRKQSVELIQSVDTVENYPPQRPLQSAQANRGVAGTSTVLTVPAGQKATITHMRIVSAAGPDIDVMFGSDVVESFYTGPVEYMNDWPYEDAFVLVENETVTFTTSAAGFAEVTIHFFQEPNTDRFK